MLCTCSCSQQHMVPRHSTCWQRHRSADIRGQSAHQPTTTTQLRPCTEASALCSTLPATTCNHVPHLPCTSFQGTCSSSCVSSLRTCFTTSFLRTLPPGRLPAHQQHIHIRPSDTTVHKSYSCRTSCARKQDHGKLLVCCWLIHRHIYDKLRL
jgi:hypothetical protein